MTIDISKSISQLTGEDWGPPPKGAATVVHDRHVWHQMPVKELSDAALVYFLRIGVAQELIVRVALDRLEDGQDRMSLLMSVFSQKEFPWKENPELVLRLRQYAGAILRSLGEWDGSAAVVDEANRWMCSIYREWLAFEMPLSSIQRG